MPTSTATTTTAGVRDTREWGQGAVARFESGYTPGVVGFGLDAHAMLGLKLDGGGGHAYTSILPEHIKDDGELGAAPHSFSTAGAAVKLKAFDTELKAGDLFLTNPVTFTAKRACCRKPSAV